VARFGGDEFAVILPDLNRPEDAAQVAEKISSRSSSRCTPAVTAVDLSASIGVAIYPYDGEDFDTLLRHADERDGIAPRSRVRTPTSCVRKS